MRYKVNRFIVCVAVACMSVTSVYGQTMQLNYDGKTHTYDLPPITLFVNDALIETPLMPPVQLEGFTLVPVREVCEALGASVEYKANEKKIYIDYGESLIILEINNKEVWVNGNKVQLDVPAKIINDKVMVPVRFVAEALGGTVNWVGGTKRAVYVYKAIEEPEVPEIEIPEGELPEPEVPETEVPEPELPDIEEPEIELPELEQPEDDKLVDLFEGVREDYRGKINTIEHNITKQANEKTSVQKVELVAGRNEVTAVISMDKAMTDAEIALVDGKLVVDIINSKNGLSNVIGPKENKFINNIRTSQFTTDTTRIVFDLASGAKIDARLSQRRNELLITLSTQTLGDVIYGEDKLGEYFVIDNLAKTQVQLDDDRKDKIITLSIPNVKIEKEFMWQDLEGEFVDQIYALNQDNTLTITIELQRKGNYIHEIQQVKGNYILRFRKPTFENMDYIGDDKVIQIELPKGLSKEDIQIQDNYKSHQLIVDLGDDYKKHLGEGTLPVDDEWINSITIKTVGTTKLFIDQKIIHTVEMKEDTDEGQLLINLLRPKEKYDKILLLDIGHGGSDAGTTGNGLQEKKINVMQANEIIKRLEEQTDIKVYTTRDDDSTLTLQYRTELANEIEADIFVSVHNNSVPGKPQVSGTEVLYFPDPTDQRGKKMAQIALDHIIEAVGTVNRGIKARDNLYVLRTSNMPAILLEAGFVSNPAEAQRLQSKAFTEQYAQAVVDAIVEIFDTLSFR